MVSQKPLLCHVTWRKHTRKMRPKEGSKSSNAHRITAFNMELRYAWHGARPHSGKRAHHGCTV